MARKKNPADAAVAYFETASLETAQAVLDICKGIVARRLPPTRKARTAKTYPPRDVADDADGSR